MTLPGRLVALAALALFSAGAWDSTRQPEWAGSEAWAVGAAVVFCVSIASIIGELVRARPRLRLRVPSPPLGAWAYVALLWAMVAVAALPGGPSHEGGLTTSAWLYLAISIGIVYGSRAVWMITTLATGAIAGMVLAAVTTDEPWTLNVFLLLMLASLGTLLLPAVRDWCLDGSAAPDRRIARSPERS